MAGKNPTVSVKKSKRAAESELRESSTGKKTVCDAELVDAEPAQKKRRRRLVTVDEMFGGSGGLFGRGVRSGTSRY